LSRRRLGQVGKAFLLDAALGHRVEDDAAYQQDHAEQHQRRAQGGGRQARHQPGLQIGGHDGLGQDQRQQRTQHRKIE
jgi:hypothetical protein